MTLNFTAGQGQAELRVLSTSMGAGMGWGQAGCQTAQGGQGQQGEQGPRKSKQGHEDGLRPDRTWAWLYRVHGWAEQGRGELETSPAVQSLGQGLMSLGSWAMGSLGGTPERSCSGTARTSIPGLWPRSLSDLFFSTYNQAFKGNF